MNRARPRPPDKIDPPDALPEVRPARKRPLVLALSIVLVIGWLVFMALMAWRG